MIQLSEESKTSSHGGSAHQSTQAERTNPWTSFQAKVAGLEMPQGQKGRGNRPREWTECSGVEWNSGHLSSTITQLNLVMPQSSHLPHGESNLQSDSSHECIGHTAVIEHTTFHAHFTVSSWRAETPLDFSLYPSHPTNG